MSITTNHVQALRAFFVDPEEHTRRTDRLAAEGDLDGYWAMVAAALVVLVRRGFTGGDRSSEITRRVARIRARLARVPEPDVELDAEVAEELLRVILGESESSDRLEGFDSDVRGETQFLLLGLWYDDVGRPDLDQLLAEARTLAETD